MPKIFGTSLIGILAATVALYLVGFVWYGPIFGEAWMSANGVTKEMAEARMTEMGPMFFIWGILITLLQAVGLSYVLQQSTASVMMTCVKICAILAILIGIPLMLYAVLYEGRSINAFGIDAGHILIGWSIAGAVLSFFRGKDAIGD